MSMTIDDAEVIRSFKAGDHDAFESIVIEYQAELLRHARRRFNDAGTAEDLVQETFVRAYRAFDRLPEDSRVRPWLHQILTNVCINEANRCRREHDKTERVGHEPTAALTGESPEHELGLDVDDTALAAALAGLPSTHREAIEKRFVDELDYDEIAETTGVTETNVRARVSRARATLRRALQGAAAIPVAVYLTIRRPGRGVAAGPDAAGTTAASETAGNASRIATTFAPAIDAASAVAANAPTSVPLLTKAAIGVGAVAITFTAAPEQPVERPPAVETQASVGEATAVTAPLVVAAPETIAPAVAAPVAAPAPTTVPDTTSPPTTLAALIDAPIVAAPAATQPVTTAPSTTAPPTTVTTTVPETTAPPTTEVAAAPPLTGGSLRGSISVAAAGPRLDLNGSVTLAGGESSDSGSLSGRLGVGAPDPAGSMRLDGVFTVQLPSGTVEFRLAGYGTSSETPADGTVPTSLSMSGVYRASGATGQLLTSGSFSGSLSGGSLSLTFTS